MRARALAGLLLVVLGTAGCQKLVTDVVLDPGGPPKEEPVAGRQRSGNIPVPADGGEWPWRLTPAAEAPPARPVEFATGPARATSFAVRPAVGRAVVTVVAGNPDEHHQATTRFVWCDTAAGTVLASWEVPGAWRAWDVSPDGREFLAAHAGQYSTTETLAVWTPAAGKAPARQCSPVRAYGKSKDDTRPPAAVKWAAWTATNRILAFGGGGELKVLDPQTLAPTGTIDGEPFGRPALTPDGALVGIPVKHGVLLLDPARGTVVGTRRVEGVGEEPLLAFSPDGSTLAVGGERQGTALDLTTGATRTFFCLHMGDTFEWAGSRHVLAGQYAYDLTHPTPVWQYDTFYVARGYGRKVWAVVAAGWERVALRPFTLPHPAAVAAGAHLGKSGPDAPKKPLGVSNLTVNGVTNP